MRKIGLALLAAVLLAGAPRPATALDGGRYGEVKLTEPSGPMRSFVIYFSGQGGWRPADQAALDALAGAGALVVGVDTDLYLARIAEQARAKPGTQGCDQLVGDAEGLSRQLQREHGHIEYQFPILAGRNEGGTLAAATLAQAPGNTLTGAVSIDPSPAVKTSRPLCSGEKATPMGSAGFTYGPVDKLNGFWTVGLTPSATKASRDYAERLRAGGMPVEIKPIEGSVAEALAALAEPHFAETKSEGVASLPLVELPSEKPSPLLAIVLSGDGGWRDLDKTIAEALQQDGVSVIGWDSVRYFWHQREPDQTAEDLTAVLDTYLAKFHARKVALIGYSFGADVLPFLYNRLPKRLQSRVVLMSLLGFTDRADWEITVTGWLGAPPSDDALPVEPEIAKVPKPLIQCFYGEDEGDSYCPELAKRGITVIKTTGGHHFDGDYAALERKILTEFRQRAGS